MKFQETQAGSLALVATPLGNLEDITLRSLTTLRQADLILAEDSRRFQILAKQYDIHAPVWTVHEQSERKKLDSIIDQLQAGKRVVLVSEAGTPGISDPGFLVVRECRRQGIPVSPIPGPCAAIAAISASGFECERFQFDGFLPRKGGSRRKLLDQALERDCATIIYESPFRVLATLADIESRDSTRDVCVARELTKIHEEFLSGPVNQIRETLAARKKLLGEFTIIIRRKPD